MDSNDKAAMEFVRTSFLDFSVAQLRHDMKTAQAWFGEEIIGVTLGHNVPFFADIAADYFARLNGTLAPVTVTPVTPASIPTPEPAPVFEEPVPALTEPTPAEEQPAKPRRAPRKVADK